MRKKHYSKIHTHIYYTILSILFRLRQIYTQRIIVRHKYERYLYKYNLFLKNAYITIQNTELTRVFYRCIKLKYLHILNTKILPVDSFCNCYNLKQVFIDKNIEEIHSCAFQNCKNLEKIYIPNTIKLIQSNAFLNCVKLQKIVFY